MKNVLLTIGLSAILQVVTQGQILDVQPAFPTVNDVVTITYNATEGNGALSGVSPVYAHAGVLTSASTGGSDWFYVQGNWGSADPQVLMTQVGPNLHQIVIDIDQFYGFPSGTTVTDLAFVFRNATGSIVGRASDGSDIFYPIYPVNSGLLCAFFAPASSPVISIGQNIPVIAKANAVCNLSLYDNSTLVSSVQGDEIDLIINNPSAGLHMLELVADNGSSIQRDTVYYTVAGPTQIANPPAYLEYGANLLNDSTVGFKFYAPNKQRIFVLGDFNGFAPFPSSQMKRSADGTTWWVEISGIQDSVVGYQYLIDESQRFADPYSHRIADPNNDSYISSTTYPNAYPYPYANTSGFVTILDRFPTAFNWQYDQSFTPPPAKDLMIYELLVRDFVHAHNYLTLIDTLDYLSNLGVNAIELMPVMEFENNESWGYDPSFHHALDKYYGTPEHFKTFVDACHERGIAVILDIVWNHAFGQSPQVQMYWDSGNNQPAADNPWFNSTCPHPPYCWGYDYDHESDATKQFMDDVNLFWLEEYHVDGFRFDFTKGMGNVNSGYSQARINLIKRMADVIWADFPDAYLILEHWADNPEEEALSDYGMLLWGNVTYDYHDAIKASGNSNMAWGLHTARGWNDPHLVSYIESHDEERGMYEAITHGSSSNPIHNVTDTTIALFRSQAAATLMILSPGPKMIWQFGEVGYDISINNPCRVCNKPIRWNYFEDYHRKNLYKIYQAALDLRLNHDFVDPIQYDYLLSGLFKRLRFNKPGKEAVFVSNFFVTDRVVDPGFQQTGWWYGYFSGDSIYADGTEDFVELAAGGFEFYSQERLYMDDPISLVHTEDWERNDFTLRAYPNPVSQSAFRVAWDSNLSPRAELIIRDTQGREVSRMSNFPAGMREIEVPVDGWSSGLYWIFLSDELQRGGSTFIAIP